MCVEMLTSRKAEEVQKGGLVRHSPRSQSYRSTNNLQKEKRKIIFIITTKNKQNKKKQSCYIND